MDREQFLGYLPDERPPALKLFLYALQQVIVMFPATIAILVWSRCNCAGLLEKYVLQREKKFSSGPVLPSYRRKSLSQAIGYLFQGLG